MSDFEDRLGRALSEGADEAPGGVGLADGARGRARVRGRRRAAVFAAAVVALVVPVAVVSQRGDAPGGDATASAAAPGWKTVAVEETSDGEGDVTVLVDVPASWVALPDSDDVCGFYDYGAPSEPCSEAEVVSVVRDGGNLDYTFGPGLRPASDFDYPVSADWLGHVSVGGADVNVASDDYQVAVRVLASARLEGTKIPDLSGGVYFVVSGGIERPALPLDAAGGYGERVEARRARDEYPYAEQIDATHWRASATVGEKRIVVTAPTPALAELGAGSARVAELDQDTGTDGWHTVTYEGDPVNESGDNTVVLDLPPGWERLDTSGCGFDSPRFGPADSDPCDNDSTVTFFPESLYDSCCGPGLADEESTSGYVITGELVAQVQAPDYETARRILASAREPADSDLDLEVWTERSIDGVTVEVPVSGDVEVEVEGGVFDGVPGHVSAQKRPGGGWLGTHLVDDQHLVRVTAPTEALALVVTSTAVIASTGDGDPD